MELLIALRCGSAHAPRHEASDANENTVQIVRPVTIISFPIGVINALRIAAIAAGPFAAVQTLIPTVQLRVLIIVGAGVTDCRNRQHDSEYNKRCMPDVIVHLTPNPGISLCSQEIHSSASTCVAFSARRW
ncbi:hypothetical protein [Bradyrhizobium sp. URHC0002]